MKKALIAVALLAVAAFVVVQTATTVRQVKKPQELKADGIPERTRTDDALDFSVAVDIAAPPPIVWALLTNAAAYPQWSSTVLKVDGSIAKTETIQLVAKAAPEHPITMKVSELQKNERMVWEDRSALRRVRTYTLLPSPDGARTTLAISETFSGTVLPLFEKRMPDYGMFISTFAKDVKAAAERVAPPG